MGSRNRIGPWIGVALGTVFLVPAHAVGQSSSSRPSSTIDPFRLEPCSPGVVYMEPLVALVNCAARGHAEDQYRLGGMFAQGVEFPEDDVEAARWLRMAADQGHAAAQHDLGLMYAEGEGVAEDHAEAVRLYRLAAAKGYAPAQGNLGLMYDNGF